MNNFQPDSNAGWVKAAGWLPDFAPLRHHAENHIWQPLWCLLFVSLLLASCASKPPSSQPVIRPAVSEQKPFVLIGRISVKFDGERSSANLRWTHRAERDEILLSGPLGQTVARIHTEGPEVVLDTVDKHYTAQSTEELTQLALGWRLPMAGLRYWVLALPDPKNKAIIKRDENGQVNIMQQNGWKIRYSRYASQSPDSLPLRIILQREEIELQLLVDEWEIK